MSTEHVLIPKSPTWPASDPDTGAPVWWSVPSEPGVAFLRCQCGRHVHLRDWTIADDGTVSPSYHHVEPYCDWHVFLRLVDWSGSDDH